MGESKIVGLNIFRMALLGAYLALSVWTFYVAYAVQDSPALLGSLVLNLLTFAAALETKQGRVLQLSWVWLGVNFVTAQALLLPEANFLLTVSSAALFLLVFDLSNFLEFVFPMRARSRGIDREQYEKTRSLVRRHAGWALLYVTMAGALALAGVAAYSPLVFTYNPILVVGITVSVALILTSLLSSEWRTGRRRKGF
jgi:hypothetical protein